MLDGQFGREAGAGGRLMQELFGIPVETLLVVLVVALAAALGVVGVLALRHPVLVKLGVRNIGRRRGRTALIVVGLMLGRRSWPPP